MVDLFSIGRSDKEKDFYKILHLEDSPHDQELVELELKKLPFPFKLRLVTNKAEYEELLKNFQPDIILSDFNLPDFNGFDALEILGPESDVIFIFVSGVMGEDMAVETLKKGADDYVIKSNLEKLNYAIRRSINERKLKREHEIEERTRHFILQNIEEFIYLIKLTDNKFWNTEIKYVSRQVNDILGYPENMFYKNSRLWLKLIHPEDKFNAIDLTKKFINSHKPVTREYRLKNKRGNYLLIEENLSPVIDKNNFKGWIGTVRDVTERKKVEFEKDKFLKDLISKNEKLNVFTETVSHKLRGPIATILGIIELLRKEKINNPLIDLLWDEAKIFDERIKALGALLIQDEDLLAKKEKINLRSLINKQTEKLEIEKDPSIKVNLNNNGVRFIKLNRKILESIFNELFVNSIKYRSSNGSLIININVDKKVDKLLIEYSDNGIGIDIKKNKDTIFKPFKQFHENSSGKGLGLFLIKHNTDLLGGRVDIKSKPGEGSTFYLNLPA